MDYFGRLCGLKEASVDMILRLCLFVALTAFLAGCGGPLSLLTGGGPNLAANVQAGAENQQGVTVRNEAPRVSIRPNARTGDIRQEQNDARADRIETFNANPPWWVWLLLILGWLLPSPGEIGRVVMRLFRN